MDHVSCAMPKKSCNILEKLRTDSLYRRKIILSLSVFCSYFNLGWLQVQIGAALPDLQRLVNIDIETASWLFTVWALGFGTGALVFGVLYDKFNYLLIICLCTLGIAACSVCLPYSGSFPVMLIVRVLTGVFSGGVDTGANAIMATVWETKGSPYMQALYLSYAVGATVSPLATGPFMSSNEMNTAQSENNTQESSCVRSNQSIIPDCGREHNQTGSTANATETLNTRSSTEVYKAFWVTSALFVSSALPPIIMYFTGKFNFKVSNAVFSEQNIKSSNNMSESKDKKPAIETVTSKKVQVRVRYFVLVCIIGISSLVDATDACIDDFLVSYAVIFLGWNNKSSVALISLFWASSCIGGLFGIFLARVMGLTKLLLLSLLLLTVSFLLILLASLFRVDIIMWISLPLSGFFMTIVAPGTISWTEENVCHVSGRIASIFVISAAAAMAVNPTLAGYMIERYNYSSLFFLLLIESRYFRCFRFIKRYIELQIGKRSKYSSRNFLTICF